MPAHRARARLFAGCRGCHPEPRRRRRISPTPMGHPVCEKSNQAKSARKRPCYKGTEGDCYSVNPITEKPRFLTAESQRTQRGAHASSVPVSASCRNGLAFAYDHAGGVVLCAIRVSNCSALPIARQRSPLDSSAVAIGSSPAEFTRGFPSPSLLARDNCYRASTARVMSCARANATEN